MDPGAHEAGAPGREAARVRPSLSEVTLAGWSQRQPRASSAEANRRPCAHAGAAS